MVTCKHSRSYSRCATFIGSSWRRPDWCGSRCEWRGGIRARGGGGSWRRSDGSDSWLGDEGYRWRRWARWRCWVMSRGSLAASALGARAADHRRVQLSAGGRHVLASGRITNPTHPMWKHLETIHVSAAADVHVDVSAACRGWYWLWANGSRGHPLLGVYLSAGLMRGALLDAAGMAASRDGRCSADWCWRRCGWGFAQLLDEQLLGWRAAWLSAERWYWARCPV